MRIKIARDYWYVNELIGQGYVPIGTFNNETPGRYTRGNIAELAHQDHGKYSEETAEEAKFVVFGEPSAAATFAISLLIGVVPRDQKTLHIAKMVDFMSANKLEKDIDEIAKWISARTYKVNDELAFYGCVTGWRDVFVAGAKPIEVPAHLLHQQTPAAASDCTTSLRA